MAKALTVKTVENMKPGTSRREIPDGLLPGLYFVMQPSGAKSWALRYRHAGKPRKLTLGTLAPSLPGVEPEPVIDGPLTLAGARTLARDKLREVAAGIDPAAVKQEAKKAPAVTQDTVAAAVEDYLRLVVVGPNEDKPKQRQGLKVASIMRRELVSRWGTRPLEDIRRKDVIALVDEIEARGTPAMAYNTLGIARTFFRWCITRDRIENSPAELVKASQGKTARDRALTDIETSAYWRAARQLGYPFGPMYRFLLLTGTRLEETAGAEWPEFHPDLLRLIRQADGPIDWQAVPDAIKLWTIPAGRFKSNAEHIVPLSNDACAILESLPRFTKGQHVFTTTEGKRPVSGFSKAKKRMDVAMLRFLRAMARKNGDDVAAVALADWRNHDTRRTVKTGMASLRIDDMISEMCLGHGRKGLQRIYDQHRYIPEMREAFEAWAGRLRTLTGRADASNVVQLRAVD